MYILSKYGWEYDDNFYFKNGDKNFIEVYTTFEIAQLALERAEVERLRRSMEFDAECFVFNFIHNYDNADITSDFKSHCKEKYKICFSKNNTYPYTEKYSMANNKVDPSTSDNFYLEFLKVYKINFYEIIEIEVIE